jgi:hypothetical protein
MYPVGSDQFEMIEYIQYYKERYTKIASKRSKNSNFPGPTKRKMYVRITVHRLDESVCFQISDSHICTISQCLFLTLSRLRDFVK